MTAGGCKANFTGHWGLLLAAAMLLNSVPVQAAVPRPPWDKANSSRLSSWLMEFYGGDREMVQCAQERLEGASQPDDFWPVAQRLKSTQADEGVLRELEDPRSELFSTLHAIAECRRHVHYRREDRAEGLKPWEGYLIDSELESCRRQVAKDAETTCRCVVKGYRKEMTYFQFEKARSQGGIPDPVKQRALKYRDACLATSATSPTSAPASKPEPVQNKGKHAENCEKISAHFVTLCARTAGRGWSGSCLAGGAKMQDDCEKNTRLTCLAGMGAFTVGFMDEAEGRGVGSARAWATVEKVSGVLNDQVCSK